MIMTPHMRRNMSQYLGLTKINVVAVTYGYRTVYAIKYCLNSTTQIIHLNYIPHFSLTSLILISVNHMRFLQWLVFLHRFSPFSVSALYQSAPYYNTHSLHHGLVIAGVATVWPAQVTFSSFVTTDYSMQANCLVFFCPSFFLFYDVRETGHICSGLTRTWRGFSISSIPWKSLTAKSSVDVSNLRFRC